MITAVHHIALIISSESCLDFYKLLGFQESFRKKRSYDTAVLMYGHGMQLEIFIDPRHPNRLLMEEPEPTGLRHFALAVDGKLEDEIERLKGEYDGSIRIWPYHDGLAWGEIFIFKRSRWVVGGVA